MKKLLAVFRRWLDTPVDSPRKTLAAVALGGCLLGTLSLYLSAGRYGIFMLGWYFLNPKTLLLNLLPFLALALLFYGLTNRAWLSYVLTGIACLAYSFPQYWKLLGRNDPLYAEDLMIVGEALQMSKTYVRPDLKILLVLAAVIFGAWALRRIYRGRLRTGTRIAVPLAVVVLCACLYPTVYTSQKVYDSLKPFPYINQWFETNKYISRGGIYPFIYSIQTALPNPPEGYDKAAAAASLAAAPSDDIPEEQKVSVIAVMYEAFADLSLCTDAITGADPYKDFHALQAESYSGTLVTNIFAGGTIDTERCALTGFQSLTNFRRTSWSYARYFAEQGYTVNGAHAGYAAFYNRRNVNENLGISDYRFIEGYYDTLFPDQIPTDAQLLPEIADYCLEQMKSGPVFSFNVTYQNHGPYPTNTANFAEEYVPQGSLSDADYHIINNYLAGAADTGARMAAMADTFRTSDEPVILLFFGDHKPWLGEQSVTYEALGIDIFSQSDESFYTYYSAPYLIWANDAAKAVLGDRFSGAGPDISPCFLMNVLFDLCGWEGPSYMKLTDQVMEAMPIVHSTGRMQVDGVLLEEAQLSEENRRLLYTLRCAQFYLAQDAGGKLP